MAQQQSFCCYFDQQQLIIINDQMISYLFYQILSYQYLTILSLALNKLFTNKIIKQILIISHSIQSTSDRSGREAYANLFMIKFIVYINIIQIQIFSFMIDATNIFCSSILRVQITAQIEQQIEQIYNNAKAIQMRLINTIKNVWSRLRPSWLQNHYFKKFYYDKMCEYICNCKSRRVSNFAIRSFYSKLAQKRMDKQQKMEAKKIIADKINNIKVKNIFSEWKKVANLQKRMKQLQKFRKKQLVKELVVFLSENRRNMLQKKIKIETINLNSQDIYSKSLLKISFQAFMLNAKMNKVMRMIRNIRYLELKVSLVRSNKQSKTKGILFHEDRLKSIIFLTWKEEYLTNIAINTYKTNLWRKYFILWKFNLPILISQKQIDLNNQCIINIAKERSTKKLTGKVFLGWREHARQMKQLRYHSSILNKYADVKSKELLLRKYFQKLRINCLNNQVRFRYHDIKLKRKVIDALKINFSNSIKKQQVILTFIQKREISKYFVAIQQFNKIYKQKIQRHRLAKLFKLFSFGIIKEYYFRNQLSSTYHKHNLLFKSIFAFKKEVIFSRKERYIIAWANIIVPMKRWNRAFKIQKYVQRKKWALMKSILRQWKLRIIRRDSERKLVKQFKEFESNKKCLASDSKMQVFQFQNIMATIAKIRNNFNAERSETMPNNSWAAIHTPSQSINFSYSLQNE